MKRLLLIAMVSCLIGAVGAWAITRSSYETQIAKIEAAQYAAEAVAAETARKRLQVAQARGDTLEAALAQTEQIHQTQALEHAREIKRLTTGRLCLNAGTVRLLNPPDSTGSGPAAPELSAPSGGVDAGGAAAASDTDVAEWINGARHQYDTCRDRLHALIEWWGGAQP